MPALYVVAGMVYLHPYRQNAAHRGSVPSLQGYARQKHMVNGLGGEYGQAKVTSPLLAWSSEEDQKGSGEAPKKQKEEIKMEKKFAFWDIEAGIVTPEDPLPTMPEIEKGSVLVIGGRGPVWRYGMAFHRAHGSAAAAVAFYDPRLGAVVVASHTPGIQEGEILDVEWPFEPFCGS